MNFHTVGSHSRMYGSVHLEQSYTLSLTEAARILPTAQKGTFHAVYGSE